MLVGIVYIIYAVAAGILIVAAFRLREALRNFKVPHSSKKKINHDDLPSVSVCIPARNESHAMTDCLQRVIESDYPKLEVIVLDDLSADQTPSLIKAFAHDGVRFIEGAPLPKNWLGKNHALNELAQEASGKYILFMDVDTRLSSHSISRLVHVALDTNAAMVSVLPRREDGIRLSTLFAPLRYLWELLFHRSASPAVASSAWMIDRQKFIDHFGSFESMKAVVQPEAKIAAHYMQQGLYRFLISNADLNVTYEKKWQSQIDTSVRLLFPLLGAKIAHALIAIIDLVIVVLPVLILLAFAVIGWSWHAAGAALLYVGYAVLYGVYLRTVWQNGWIIGALLWPVIAVQEAVIIFVSAKQYVSGTVTWKGRTVPLPTNE